MARIGSDKEREEGSGFDIAMIVRQCAVGVSGGGGDNIYVV